MFSEIIFTLKIPCRLSTHFALPSTYFSAGTSALVLYVSVNANTALPRSSVVGHTLKVATEALVANNSASGSLDDINPIDFTKSSLSLAACLL